VTVDLGRGERAFGKSREQANTEFAHALRSGDILAGGELSLTRAQMFPSSYRATDLLIASRGLEQAPPSR
jgi:hypothetical protein